MVRVNPDDLPFNPVQQVTGLFDGHDGVTGAVRDLEEAGMVRNDVCVFTGPEGAKLLDPEGDEHGTGGRWYRIIEKWVSDTSEFHEHAAATLHAGGFVIAIPAPDDEVRERAMRILEARGARDVKYWANWFVEQGKQTGPVSGP